MKQITLGLTFLSLLFAGVSLIEAADPVGDYAPTEALSCIDLKNNLILTSRDARTNNEVTSLQEFLQAKGYLETDPTGYFGSMTKAAVIKFQVSVPLAGTGYVGPKTRAAIKALTCGTSTPPIHMACTQEIRFCPNGDEMERSPSCAWQPEKCSTATATSSAPVCAYVNVAGGSLFSNVSSACTFARNGMSSESNPDLVCKCTSPTTAPTGENAIKRGLVSNSLAGPWVTYATNAGTVFVKITGVNRSLNSKVCINREGSDPCQNISGYRTVLPSEWLDDNTILIPRLSETVGYHNIYVNKPGDLIKFIATYAISAANPSATCDYKNASGVVQSVFGGTATCTTSIVGQAAPGLPEAICRCGTTPVTTNPSPDATCKYKNVDGSAPFTNVIGPCTQATNGQFAQGSTNLYCSCNGLTLTSNPATTLTATVSNSLSGPWASSAYNSGKIYTKTTGLVKANSPKGCASALGSTGCLLASNQREYTSSEWINDTTVITTMDGGGIANGSYDFYVAYPGKAAVKVGTISLVSGSSQAPVQSTQIRAFISNSPSGPWIENGIVNNSGNIYSRTTGIDRSRSPKGCASPSGSTGCLNLSAHRDFFAGEWADNTTIQTIVAGGQFPSGSYDTYISYGSEIIKTGTFTLKATQSAYSWVCVVPGPATVNTAPYACGSANVNTSMRIDGYDCYCRANPVSTFPVNILIADKGSTDISTISGLAMTILENLEKKVTSSLALINNFAGAATVSASTRANKSCVSVSRNLHRGDESVQTTKLQKFLIDKGFLSENASGFFGDLTTASVKAYQASVGIPQTGMVYEMTRQAISAETCN